MAELIRQKNRPFLLVGIEKTPRRRDLVEFIEAAKDKEIAAVV
ncbi:hypothetical protein [Chryseobacterium viscerum]|nr:hypothetical protein [Chryseobacterium viscerum]